MVWTYVVVRALLTNMCAQSTKVMDLSDCPVSGWVCAVVLAGSPKMLVPVVAACGKGGIVTKAGSGLNVGFAALAGIKHLPSILLDLQSFFWILLDSVLLLFVGMVFFEKGDGIGLLGSIFFTSD